MDDKPTCFTCHKLLEGECLYVIEWDEDGPFMTATAFIDGIRPDPKPEDIYCSDECADKSPKCQISTPA